MVEIIWTDQALADIEHIAEFISKDSEKYARRQVKKFFDRAAILKSNPFSGRTVPEINNENIRELIINSYRIIYLVVTPGKLSILTVHHGARLLPDLPTFE
jgi:addiction module RelE/StbE family toxin